jgi:hypothetical protein
MNVVNINYRLASDSLAPAAVEDCRCAFRWIYRHAKEYGFDTNKIVIAGESAGGHLALITAMLEPSAGFDNECLDQEDNPPLKAAASSHIQTQLTSPSSSRNQMWFALKWFGSIPQSPDQLAVFLDQLRARPSTHHSSPRGMKIRTFLRASITFEESAGSGWRPNQLITLHGTIHGWSKEMKVEEQVFDA